MLVDDKIFLGASERPEYLHLKYANRHGLITGATGTGKTVTLQTLAEGFSAAGVPVFAADIKGDLSGMSKLGQAQEWQTKRAEDIGFTDYASDVFPTMFWDLFGEQGHPVRATISEMGPVLLSRILDLNDTQEGVLNIAFRVADDDGLLLLDLKDLRALLVHIQERGKEISSRYGNVAAASIGAIQRQLLILEQQGANNFFGERALEIADLMRTDTDGRGFVSVLAADQLMQSPRLYSTFLLWLLSELFEELPEVGDIEKPKLVFFFDEAHLLFDDAPKALIDKVEQVVKLIRSKGVGVYFVTQNPVDIPESVLAQLSNRIQHALRAHTPREQKAVRVAAETFRPNPAFSTEEAITQLGVGEALVSVLEEKGVPSIVGRTLIRPPSAQVGPISRAERDATMANSPVGGLYDTVIDRESAYEILERRARDKQLATERTQGEVEAARAERAAAPRRSTRQTPVEAAVNSFARSVANTLGREIMRGILGGLRGKR
ncbi:helicase HerA-like domain-containing protein [Devosia aurantiaca]|uniref:DUF853 family protein n=1 Tax=Devosia aurantiaca TaxID=2714858 RepID=A0A6M1SGQ5_9HYPH|nr:helicase HerA-like domain-containing protein [Devosia aurantiaca]NGP18647.1 DUF853 family protein [Devosia aurantiaca]